MVTRQSTRRINFSEFVHKVDKKDHGHKFVGISKDYIDHGDPTFECSSCGTLLCNGEGSSSRNNKLDYKLTTDIRDLLDEINPLVKDFRMAGKRIRSSDDQKISLRLIGTRQRDGRQYNLPTTSEVAALIVGDFDSMEHKRDIILQCQDGDYKRISKLHPSYLALHYPLFFPYSEDNYRTDIFHKGITDYDEKTKEHAYLSVCEAAWRIYGFDIHYRTPSVERLPFHLKDEQ
ncbi:hypothetical protein Tco_0913690 [Tanacetum coccineum]